MYQSQLLSETRSLLQNRQMSLREISNKTGINFHWLGKFQQGLFEDPGVNKVEELHKFLCAENDSAEE